MIKLELGDGRVKSIKLLQLRDNFKVKECAGSKRVAINENNLVVKL